MAYCKGTRFKLKRLRKRKSVLPSVILCCVFTYVYYLAVLFEQYGLMLI